jgi:hypothetical protein
MYIFPIIHSALVRDLRSIKVSKIQVRQPVGIWHMHCGYQNNYRYTHVMYIYIQRSPTACITTELMSRGQDSAEISMYHFLNSKSHYTKAHLRNFYHRPPAGVVFVEKS